MTRPQLKVSFLLPQASADWAGQALVTYFPDGLLSGAVKNSLTPFSGWSSQRDPQSLEDIKSALRGMGATRLRFRFGVAKDWVREYKSRFPMQTLGRFVVLPEWRKRARLPKGKFPIVLVQGQAFGTGLHQSTRLMLAAIAASHAEAPQARKRASHAEAPQARRRVLDIGAGSGILGFACLRLGAKKVLSLEIEDAACDEMRINAKLNGYKPSQFSVRCGSFPKVMQGERLKADLVLANIVTPVLCALMRVMALQTAKGGTLLFSGIHTEAEAKKVAASARATGLKIVSRTSKGEWWCLRALK